MGNVVDLDFISRQKMISDAHPLHEDLLPKRHWCANAHADNVSHRAQEVGGAPSADQHVTFDGQLQYLLGGIARQPLAIDCPSLQKRGLALEKAVHLAFAHTRTLGDALFDKLMM